MTEDVVVSPGPGATVGGFRLLDVLAHGETGTVYRAEAPSSQNVVALKLVEPELCANASVMHRIRRETKNAIKLASANVARIHDCGDHEGRFYIVREWVEGHALSAAMREEGPMAVERAAAVAHQICAGLALIHRVGLVHRDVKPNHAILCESAPGAWVVKLIDIGLARKISEVHTSRDVFGTLAYLSPEQAEGKLVSFRSDLYALGALFHELLTGAPPFSGDPAAVLELHRTAAAPSLDSLRDDVPAPLALLVTKLMSKQASARPFSAAMVQRELERIVPSCKDPLGPAVRGGPRPVVRQALAAVPASPVVPASSPPRADAEMGMAQTLFGGTADLDAGEAPGAPGPTGQLPGPALGHAPPASTPQRAAAGALRPSGSQQPGAPTPGAGGFQPASPGAHKKTMLGMPVVDPTAQRGTLAGRPGAVAHPAPPPVEIEGGGGVPVALPSQVAVPLGVQAAVDQRSGAAGPSPTPTGAAGAQPAYPQPGAQAYAQPETATAEIIYPTKRSPLLWVLIFVGVFVLLSIVGGVVGLASCLFCSRSTSTGETPEPAPLVERFSNEPTTHGSGPRPRTPPRTS